MNTHNNLFSLCAYAEGKKMFEKKINLAKKVDQAPLYFAG